MNTTLPELVGTPLCPNGVGETTPLERIGDFTVFRILGEEGKGTAYLLQAVPAVTPEAKGGTAPAKVEPTRRHQPKAGRILTLLIVGLGLLPLCWWAAMIYQVDATQGTLVVAVDDEEVEARLGDGKFILTGPEDEVLYTLTPGERGKKIQAGAYKIHLEGADGLILDTPEFTLDKRGKVTVRVTMVPPAVTRKLDPDRRAAEYVLSIGGTAGVNGEEIEAVADLPPQPFYLTSFNSSGNKQVDDGGLAHILARSASPVGSIRRTQPRNRDEVRHPVPRDRRS